MSFSSVFICETEDSELSYLIVHVEKPPHRPNEKYYFNSNIIVKNSIFPIDKLPNDDTTYTFTIDMTTGGISFYGLPNIDIFRSPKKAWEKLSLMHKMKPGMPLFLGTHLIGATIEGNSLFIFSIKEKEEVGVIFDRPVFKIKKTNIHVITWDQKGVYGTTECHTNKPNYKKPEFLEFEINDNHFFSPFLDLSSPFPYPINFINNNYFCWNKRFLRIFEDVGALQSCVTIFQGTFISMNDCRTCFSDNILFVLKRSSSNSGTRYLARGMNEEEQEPANECECEMIFVKDQNQYFCHSWRRGSPPIFWETDATLFTTKNIVKKEANEMSSYGKTHFYFLQDIFVRFDVKKCHAISLLKNEGSEKDINDAYEESIDRLNHSFYELHSRSNNNANNNNTIENNNNNNNDEVNNSNDNVNNNSNNVNNNEFYKIVFTRFGFDEIEQENVINYFIQQMSDEIDSIKFTQVCFLDGQVFLCQKHQNIVYRFNCADSLDRTNVTSFALGIMLTSKYANDYGTSLKKNTSALLNDPINFLQPTVINFLCKIFTKSGDIASKMYANTTSNRSYLIKNFFVPDKSDDDIEINNDVVNIVWRQINSVIFDKKRQQMIFEWLNSDDFKRKRFILDEQHIGFYQFITHEYEKQQNSENDSESNLNNESFRFIDDSILSSNEKCFVLATNSLSMNEVCVVFPEPVVVCSVSFLVVPQKTIQNVPSFDLFISDQIADHDTFVSGSNTTFMHHIYLPSFINDDGNFEKRWVTYDLIYIAKNSSQFPLDPETLRLSRFAKIRFNMNSNKKDNEVYVSNIKFSVKVPSNPKTILLLKGHPPSIDIINQSYEAEIDINSKSYIENILEIERNRIERGISDYHRNNTTVSKGLNPWIYDFPSQILVQKSDNNKCIICNAKFNERIQPNFFVSLKFMPQFVIEFNEFVRKNNISIPPNFDSIHSIIEKLGLRCIKVCSSCKSKLIVFEDDQEKLLTETVFIKVNSTKEKVTRNFKALPEILNENNGEFTFAFNSNFCRVFSSPTGIVSNGSHLNDCLTNDSDIRIKSKKIVIGFSFISTVRISKIKLSLNNIYAPISNGQLKVSILFRIKNQNSIIEKVAAIEQNNLVYEFIDFPNGLIRFFDLIIEDFSTKNERKLANKNEIDISIKRVEIEGKFGLKNSPSTNEIAIENSIPNQPVVLQPFPENNGLPLFRIPGWDDQTRTQKVLFENGKNYNAIVFKPIETKLDKKPPISLIIAYYDEDDNICYFESLIIPSWFRRVNNNNLNGLFIDGIVLFDENDSYNQFIFPIRDFINIKYLLIFYLDRIENITPYRVMLTKI